MHYVHFIWDRTDVWAAHPSFWNVTISIHLGASFLPSLPVSVFWELPLDSLLLSRKGLYRQVHFFYSLMTLRSVLYPRALSWGQNPDSLLPLRMCCNQKKPQIEPRLNPDWDLNPRDRSWTQPEARLGLELTFFKKLASLTCSLDLLSLRFFVSQHRRNFAIDKAIGKK